MIKLWFFTTFYKFYEKNKNIFTKKDKFYKFLQILIKKWFYKNKKIKKIEKSRKKGVFWRSKKVCKNVQKMCKKWQKNDERDTKLCKMAVLGMKYIYK